MRKKKGAINLNIVSHDLIGGIFGTECISFTPRQDNSHARMTFYPDYHGFDQVSLKDLNIDTAFDPEKDAPLSGITKTAWVKIEQADEAYYNQPEAAPTYTARKSERGTAALHFEPAGRVPGGPFPLFPFEGGLKTQGDLNALAKVESRSLVVERRRGVAGAAFMRRLAARDPLAERWVTTPQGFLAREVNGEWNALKIAMGQKGDPSALTIYRQPGMTTRWPLQEVLQREDLFSVITDLNSSAAQIEKATWTIKVADWTLNVNIPLSRATAPELFDGTETPPPLPTLIFKHRKGKLSELVANVDRWAGAQLFNRMDFSQLANATLKKIEIIGNRANSSDANEKLLYASINKRLNDENWLGVFVFDAMAPTGGFPSGVAALSAGLHAGSGGEVGLRIWAMGVDSNRIADEPAPDGVLITESTVFAVIDYQRPESEIKNQIPATKNNDFTGFRVDRLGLLIENSQVAAFFADMKLRLGTLFGSNISYGSSSAEAGKYQILGTYERRMVNGQSKDIYSFVGNRNVPFPFESSPFLHSVQITRAVLTSNVEDKRITGKFALSGSVTFNKDKIEAFGVSLEKVTFADAAVVMKFNLDGNAVKDVQFALEFGAVRLETSGESKLDKILSQMPFKISGLLVGGGNGFEFPDINYFKFDGGSESGRLAFGIEFTLDAGFFGRLVSAARKLNIRVAIAWPSFKVTSGTNWQPSIGFRFDGADGGPLELGIQGVLRITAESVKILDLSVPGKPLYLIAIRKCQLEVVGYKIPDKDTLFNLYIYTPPDKPSQVGWFGAIKPDGGGGDPFNLEFLGLGQRVYPHFKEDPQTTQDFVNQLIDVACPKSITYIPSGRRTEQDEKDEAKRFADTITYDPKAGWLAALRASIVNFIRADIAFADKPGGEIYGLRVEIPEGGKIFFADAIYRRLADDLGVFSVEFSFPPEFRTFEAGAATVVLGVPYLELYTNGDWLVNFGFPRGLDYTRSFQVQILPFIGWGGVYFAKKSAKTSAFLPPALGCKPILEFGFACRIGIGKEIRRGAFSAGASISVFGIIEGGFGALPNTNSDYYYVLEGAVGVIAEIFGAVDFGIVRAGVSLQVYVQNRLRLEKTKPLVIYAEAGVSVAVTVVVARIRVWDCTIEIKVTFSFQTQVSFRWEVDAVHGVLASSAYALASDIVPIDWTPKQIHLAKEPLALMLAFDTAILEAGANEKGKAPKNGKKKAIARTLCKAEARVLPVASLLDADGEKAGVALVAGLFRWALLLHGGTTLTSFEDSTTKYSRREFDKFARRIEEPDSLTRGTNPLNYDVITKFLDMNYQVTIETLAASGVTTGGVDQVRGIFVPLPPDLILGYQNTGAVIWDQSKSHSMTEQQEGELRKFFDKMTTLMREREDKKLSAAVASKKTAAVMVFEDWIALLLKSAVMAARKLYDRDGTDNDKQFGVDELVGSVSKEAANTLNMASRFMLHGLRLPTKETNYPSTKSSVALAEFLGLQFTPTASDISLRIASTAKWITFRPGGDTVATLKLGKIQDINQNLNFEPPRLKPSQPSPVQIKPKLHPLNRTTTISGAQTWSLKLLPEDFGRELDGLLLQVDYVVRADIHGVLTDKDTFQRTRIDGPQYGTWTWATTVELSVRPVVRADGSVLPRVYELIGADEWTRKRIEAILVDGCATAGLHILRPEQDSTLRIDNVGTGAVTLIKTNLSVENRPPELLARSLADVFAADLKAENPENFLELVKQCSIVNSGGFWLSYNVNDVAQSWFENGFKTGQTVKIILAVEFPAKPTPDNAVPKYVQAVLVKMPLPKDVDLEFTRSDEKGIVVVPEVPAGCVLLSATRSNPNFSPALAPEEADLKEIEARYHLLDFGSSKTGNFTAISSDSVLPFGPEEPNTPKARIARNADGESATWTYRIVVPLYRFATKNLEVGRPSPYIGIGDADLGVELGLRDVFGNRLQASITPGETLLYNAPARIPIAHLYTDKIPSPSEWPGTTVSYAPDRAGSKTLSVKAIFDPAVFLELNNAAKSGLSPAAKGLRDFYVQLDHILSGPKVAATLEIIGCTPIAALTQLQKLVAAIVTRMDAQDPSSALIPQVLGTLSLATWPTTSVSMLQVTLKITRDTKVVAKDAQRDPSTYEALYDVPMFLQPQPAKSSGKPAKKSNAVKPPPEAWVKFATEFEAAMPVLRFLRGLDRDGKGSAWVAKKEFLDVQTAFGTAPTRYVFALAPLSTSLVTENVVYTQVYTDGTSSKIPLSVADADLDALASDAITLLEKAIEPSYAVKLRITGPEALDNILSAKKRIAAAYKTRLVGTTPADQGAPGALIEDARRLTYNRMCANLMAAYNIGAVIQLVSKGYSENGDTHRFLFGEPVYSPDLPKSPTHDDKTAAIESEALSFDVAKLERRTKDANGTAPALTFAVSWKNSAQATKVGSIKGSITYRPTFIEVSRTLFSNPISGDAYVPSTWLQVLTDDGNPAKLAVEGRLPLRRFPPQPMISEHVFKEGLDTAIGLPAQVTAARSWQYDFRWTHDAAVQDSFDLLIVYPKSKPVRLAAQPGDRLLETLTSLDRNKALFLASLARLGAGTASDIDKQILIQLGLQIADFATEIGGYASYHSPAAGGSAHVPIVGPVGQPFDGLSFRADEKKPFIELKHRESQPAATWIGFMKDRPTQERAPINALTYPVEPADLPPNAFRLETRQLDVMHEPAAWAGVRVLRNAGLSEAFVYVTPWVRVPEVMPARRVYRGWIDLHPGTAPAAPLSTVLNNFVGLLFDGRKGGFYCLQAFVGLGVPTHPVGYAASRDKVGTWATHPLPSLPPRALNNDNDIKLFTKDLEDLAKAWIGEVPIAQDPTVGIPEFRFSFTVYANVSRDVNDSAPQAEVPVLTIPKTFVLLSRITS